MLNPMSRTHQGYSQANQSLLEEDEHRSSEDDEDLEAGRNPRSAFQSGAAEDIPLAKSKAKRQRHISRDSASVDVNILHPNIHREDKIYEQDSSDDEVPQSLMIEAASCKPPSKGKGKASNTASVGGRGQPLPPASGMKLAPVARAAPNEELPPPVLAPLRPSEVGGEADGEVTPRNASPGTRFSEPLSDVSRQSRQMRGLDDYEKALWNWVNVYNLDAFLQEVYYYYEGKGIYSIALSRGLNLLLVSSLLCHFDGTVPDIGFDVVGRWDSSLASPRFYLAVLIILGFDMRKPRSFHTSW